MKLPKIRNRIEHQFIDATPKGYALRILKHYRTRCSETWEVSGLPENKTRLYKLMNEAQIERAKELDEAIKRLEEIK